MPDDQFEMIAPAGIINPAAVQVDEVPLAPPQGDGAEAPAAPPPPEQVAELDRFYAGVPGPPPGGPEARPDSPADPDAAETLNALAVAIVLGGHSVADHVREMSTEEEPTRPPRRRPRDRRQD